MQTRVKYIMVYVLALVLALPGCSQDRKVESGAYAALLNQLLDHSVAELSVPQALAMRGEVHFLDAREPVEYAVSHIDGAVSVGYDHFDLSVLPALSKTDTIIVYCSVGYRSEKVAEQLQADGYKYVYNLVGGIFEWKNQGESVIGPDGQATDRVHAYDPAWGIWLKEGKRVYE